MTPLCPFRWTPEAVEVLRAFAASQSPRQIAALLGCSRDAVIGKAYREGVPWYVKNPGQETILSVKRARRQWHLERQKKRRARFRAARQSVPELVP